LTATFFGPAFEDFLLTLFLAANKDGDAPAAKAALADRFVYLGGAPCR
jgi:hypothetical protein